MRIDSRRSLLDSGCPGPLEGRRQRQVFRPSWTLGVLTPAGRMRPIVNNVLCCQVDLWGPRLPRRAILFGRFSFELNTLRRVDPLRADGLAALRPRGVPSSVQLVDSPKASATTSEASGSEVGSHVHTFGARGRWTLVLWDQSDDSTRARTFCFAQLSESRL